MQPELIKMVANYSSLLVDTQRFLERKTGLHVSEVAQQRNMQSSKLIHNNPALSQKFPSGL